MNRREFLGAGGLLAVGTLSGCLGRTPFGSDDEVAETVSDTFVVGEVDSIRVVNDIGDVTVRAADVDGIRARVIKRSTNGQDGLDDITARLSLDGGVLTVETSIDDSARWFTRSSPSTDVSVTVPAGEDGPPVDSITSELGDVTLLDTRGDTTVRTDLGDVTAEGVGGDAEVGTELGDVAVGVATDLDVDVLAESVADIASDLPLANVERRGESLSGRLNDGGPRVHVFSELGDVALRGLSRE